jgi:tyrosine-protein kinase Etk/Wzc
MNLANQSNGVTNRISPFLPTDEIDFQKIIGELYRYLWVILAVSLCTCAMSFFFTFTIQPKYLTTALIQVNTQTSNSNILSVLGYKSGTSASDSQLALIKTRYILEPVIVQNNLNILVTPHYFPVFGAWMARHYHGNGAANPLLGLSSYAWGGEKISVKKFSVAANHVGETFRLVAGKNNTYQLFSSQGNPVLTGKVNQPSMNNDGTLLALAALNARPGTEFFIRYQSPHSMTSALTHDLIIMPILGNDPTQNTGIAQLQLIGSDPNRVVQTLNAIVNYAVVKNAQQKAQETQKTLNFLNQRLPELKTNLEKAEDSLNQYHIKNTTLSMSIVSGILVRELTSLEQAIEKIKSQKEELLQIYTPQHSLVLAAQNKEVVLQKKLADIKAQIKKFPLANQEEINLLRDAKIKNAMYVSLLHNQQQLEVIKAGLTTDIVALADATPATNVPTHKLLLVLMGFLMGAFLSTIVILLKSILIKAVESAEQLEEELQIPVQSIIPFSRKQQKMEKAAEKGLSVLDKGMSSPLVLANLFPDDMAIESLHSLRISLHITSPSATHRIIALMGSIGNIGKSFVAVNLSQLIANSGKKTLLIDADIRKGKLHETLRQAKTNGLSEYLEEKCDYENLVRAIDENLFFIPSGVFKRHPTELFQSQRFQALLKRTKEEFDQVIIDTPPILPVTDSMLITQHCDVKLFIVSAARDTLADVKQAIKKAHKHGIEIDGIVLNYRKSPISYTAQQYRYSYGTK